MGISERGGALIVSANAVELQASARRRVTGAVFGVRCRAEREHPVNQGALDDFDDAGRRRSGADAAPVPFDDASVFEPLQAPRGVLE